MAEAGPIVIGDFNIIEELVTITNKYVNSNFAILFVIYQFISR